jgi:hypothetical protein
MKRIAAYLTLSVAFIGMAAAIPSPIAHFNFTSIQNNIVNSVTGEMIALPLSVAIKTNGAFVDCLALKRQDDSFVSLGRGYGFTGDFSLSFWVRTPRDYKDTGAIVLGKHSAGWYNGYFVMINAEWGYGSPGMLSFYYSNAVVTSSRYIIDGLWHHVGIVYRKDKGAELYIDGTLERIGNPNPIIVPNVDLILGGITYDKPVGSYGGDLDELTIFDKALNKDEVITLALNPGWPSSIGQAGQPGSTGQSRQTGSTGQTSSTGQPGTPTSTSTSTKGMYLKVFMKNGQVMTVPTADISRIEFGN